MPEARLPAPTLDYVDVFFGNLDSCPFSLDDFPRAFAEIATEDNLHCVRARVSSVTTDIATNTSIINSRAVVRSVSAGANLQVSAVLGRRARRYMPSTAFQLSVDTLRVWRTRALDMITSIKVETGKLEINVLRWERAPDEEGTWIIQL